jgi:hypothetical protein
MGWTVTIARESDARERSAGLPAMVKKHGGSLEAHEVRKRWMHRRSVTPRCPEPTMDRDDGQRAA